jgi:hypothetical protein
MLYIQRAQQRALGHSSIFVAHAALSRHGVSTNKKVAPLFGKDNYAVLISSKQNKVGASWFQAIFTTPLSHGLPHYHGVNLINHSCHYLEWSADDAPARASSSRDRLCGVTLYDIKRIEEGLT